VPVHAQHALTAKHQSLDARLKMVCRLGEGLTPPDGDIPACWLVR
jgi:hypothetical protein